MALSEEAQRLLVIVASVACLSLVVVSLTSIPPTVTTACSVLECGPAFIAGNPIGPKLCNASSVEPIGCLSPNDYFYTLSNEGSTVEFGQVLFNVTNASGSTLLVPSTGGFTIVNASGRAVAEFHLEKGGPLEVPTVSDWIYFTEATGVSARSLLGGQYLIVIDMGSLDPAGQGDIFSATATVSGVSIVSSLTLP